MVTATSSRRGKASGRSLSDLYSKVTAVAVSMWPGLRVTRGPRLPENERPLGVQLATAAQARTTQAAAAYDRIIESGVPGHGDLEVAIVATLHSADDAMSRGPIVLRKLGLDLLALVRLARHQVSVRVSPHHI